ncbi:peptidase family M20/M25/M40 [Xylariales sp. PMI_506]|nr:peptidase family M20/M25/M40 [Xylariales sp. PMI_506]
MSHSHILPWVHKGSRSAEPQCPQVDPLLPSKTTDALDKLESFLESSKFLNDSVGRLAGAVQIPSESYDDLGPVGEDKRWEIMYDVAAYLEKTFPLVYSTLQFEKINTHALLYTWKGSDETLKPTLFMAHIDVVPVAASTVDQWTHPPYSGFYDGHHLWGRGSSDCKNTLIGLLEAIELLIDAGFEPRRTVILSFGFDEESRGSGGAGALSSHLLDRYGKDSVAVIVDEGAGINAGWGTYFAAPGVAEKGNVNVEVVVRMPGGHSSVPPPHNGIGVMSEFITLVEAHPFEPYFAPENPILGYLECAAAHAPEFPAKWKKLLPSPGGGGGGRKEERKKAKLAHEVAEADRFLKYLFTTSQAVDIINGGVKSNALPERTTALINHRVNIGERVADVQAHLTALAAKIAHKYNLTLNAFGGGPETPSSITLQIPRGGLEPAPVTPTVIDALTPYRVLAGTTRALYGDDVVLAPALATGNTDTRFYWDLSRHIFRFQPGWDPEDPALGNIHTVDEKISMLNHVGAVKWYTLFVRNLDEVDFP